MARRSTHLPFRIFYSTTYTALWLLVLIILAITPASIIYTSIADSAYQYTFIVGGVYVLTALIAVFIYSSRLYTNRTVLAAVGKSYIPVEEGELGRNVRKIIAQALERSALIAWEGRPRDLSKEITHGVDDDAFAQEKDNLMETRGEKMTLVGKVVQFDPVSPPWGHIEHPGWSSPSQLDTLTSPHIFFMTVVQELPNLIEARAVSLAPTAATAELDETTAALDAQTIALLQRPPLAGLRDYLGYLDSLDLIYIPDNGDDFLLLYEQARFSPEPLSEASFQRLMAAFADLLSGMTQFTEDANGKSKDSKRPMTATSTSTAVSDRSTTSITSSGSAIRHRSTASRLPSVYAIALQEPDRTPTPTGRFQDAARASTNLSRQNSLNSVLRPDRDSAHSLRSYSSSSLRSAQSVIRLTPSPGPGQLPYEWVGNGG